MIQKVKVNHRRHSRVRKAVRTNQLNNHSHKKVSRNNPVCLCFQCNLQEQHLIEIENHRYICYSRDHRMYENLKKPENVFLCVI